MSVQSVCTAQKCSYWSTPSKKGEQELTIQLILIFIKSPPQVKLRTIDIKESTDLIIFEEIYFLIYKL